MKEQQNNFFDGKTLVAILLVGIIWFAWEKHLQTKYPEAYKKTPVTAKNVESVQNPVVKAPLAKVEAVRAESKNIAESAPIPEELTTFEDSNWKFDFSSAGMSIKNLVLKKMTDREGNFIKVGDSKAFFPGETRVIDTTEPIHFKINRVNETTFQGIGKVGNFVFTKIVKINSDTNSFLVEVKGTNLDSNFKGFLTFSSDKIVRPEQKGFFQQMFFPSYDMPEYFVVTNGKTERHMFMDKSEFSPINFERVSHYSIGSHYFALAFVDNSPVLPTLGLNMGSDARDFVGSISHKVINPSDTFDIRYSLYAGPKSLDTLSAVDEMLPQVINFGVFGFLSRPMLRIMKTFYNWFHNWGIAIILLTLLVRVFVFPFNKMSYKSIKAMQTIQPLLKNIQEKYKDNRQEINLATMQLMKEHKVNPLGGCLPMLMQLPIFFALYQVFGQSIELYKAPFVFWIQDLSVKDPLYVLPIGMAVTMFVQQKMTPTSVDPAQARVMMIMPVLFSLMMLNLPSALNLYIFVSSLFAVIQQAYFMNDGKKNSNNNIILAKAKLVEK